MIKKLKLARRFVAAGVMSAFMFVGIANVNAQSIKDGLIAYWPFDGDLNDAIGDSHGEGMGSDEIAYDDGQFGQGIDLDGIDQFIETPVENEEMFDFQDGTGFSISAWFRVDGFTKSWQALIAKGEGNRWRVHRRSGEPQLTGNGGNADVPGGTGDVNDGEIHHLVLVSAPENGECSMSTNRQWVLATAASPASIASIALLMRTGSCARPTSDTNCVPRPTSTRPIAAVSTGRRSCVSEEDVGRVECVVFMGLPSLVAVVPQTQCVRCNHRRPKRRDPLLLMLWRSPG